MGADHARTIADDVPGAVLQIVCDASAERARAEAMSTLQDDRRTGELQARLIPLLTRPDAASPDDREVVQMPTQIQHFIGGKPMPGKSGRGAPVYNPATGEQTASVPLASAAEVDEAVALARAAFPAWAMTTPLRRARILNRFLRLLEENQARLPRRSPPSTARSTRTRWARSRAGSRWSSSRPEHRSS